MTDTTSKAPTMVRFSYLGVPYEAPEGLTIMRALETAGIQCLHGSGCRAGFCGACPTIYRLGNDPAVRVALACQTPIVPGMDLAQIPYYPVHRADYDVANSGDPARDLNRLYPELATCLGCNTCTRSCPVGLDVMGYVGSLLAGDLPRVAELSFACVSCGLCAARCPAGIAPFTAALHARRATGRAAVRSPELHKRVSEIQTGVYLAELQKLRQMPRAELEATYQTRELRT